MIVRFAMACGVVIAKVVVRIRRGANHVKRYIRGEPYPRTR